MVVTYTPNTHGPIMLGTTLHLTILI